MKIDVIAKVDGVHAVTGLGLTAGETYIIDEDKFGDEVFQKTKAPPSPLRGEGRGEGDLVSDPKTENKEG